MGGRVEAIKPAAGRGEQAPLFVGRKLQDVWIGEAGDRLPMSASIFADRDGRIGDLAGRRGNQAPFAVDSQGRAVSHRWALR
jgi:hypothetical protein